MNTHICPHRSLTKKLLDKLECNCGEERKVFEWTWEDSSCTNVVLSNQNRDVVFHPVYSSGTAAVKGERPLQQNMYHYWEIKVLTNLYGTDVMIGVGTSKIKLSDWKLRFASMLGCHPESWGFSYTGLIKHNRLARLYAPYFTIGSLIGVHLDMCAGTLEYYLDRRPLGVAFRNLKKYELYPMVCSTAAQSSLRIICSLSETSTLQIKCLQVIANNPELLTRLHNIPGVMKMVAKKYFWLIPPLPVKKKPPLDLEDECVLPLDSANQKQFYSDIEVQENPELSYCRYLAMHYT